MNTSFKIALGMLLVAAIIVGLWSFRPNDNSSDASLAAEDTTIRIADLPTVHGLPLYLAMEKGYFAEAGIEVERVTFESPNQLIDALMAGQVDFTSSTGAMGITGIADFKNPGQVEIYVAAGGNNQVSNDAIFVNQDSEIASIEDLEGDSLGILPGIQWRTIATYVLEQHGLEVNEDVTLVELAPGLQAQALSSGQVDALLAIESIATVIRANNLGKEIVPSVTVNEIADPFFGGAGAVRTDFANNNPLTTQKFIEIYARAVAEIQADPQAAKQYVVGYTPLPSAIAAQAPVMNFRMYDDFSQADIAAVQTFYDLFEEYEVVDGTMDFQHLLYNPVR